MLTIHLERKGNRGKGGGTPALYLVRAAGPAGARPIVGLVEKFVNTRTDFHPWKAYLGYGMDAKYLGAFYPADGGSSAAVNAIANALAAAKTAAAVAAV